MNTLQSNAKYKVDFIGYSAFVNQRRGGKISKCAQVDFQTGTIGVHSENGYVIADRDIAALIEALPVLTGKIERCKSQHGSSNANKEKLTLVDGDDYICIDPDANVVKFVDRIKKTYAEIANLLGQVQEIGCKIVRRPYSEYVEKIEQTGICEVEYHGFGLWVGDRLEFTPQYRIGHIPAAGDFIKEQDIKVFAQKRSLDIIPLLRSLMTDGPDKSGSDKEWLNNHKLKVAALGRVLQFFNIAEPNDSLTLGWKPKPLFFEMLENDQQKDKVRKKSLTEREGVSEVRNIISAIAIGSVARSDVINNDDVIDVRLWENVTSDILLFVMNVLFAVGLISEDSEPSILLRQFVTRKGV